MKILSAVLTLALLSISSVAVAQWQWLDKDGRRVFSDRAPPSDVLDKDILKRPNTSAKAPAAKAASTQASAPASDADPSAARATPLLSGVDKELEAKKKQATDAEAAKRRADEDRALKSRIENCARAKQSLADFESGARIARTNSAGEREILDDAGRAAERAQIQRSIASDCRQ